jgi:hypothetical protein
MSNETNYARNWSARRWVEGEIQDLINSYGGNQDDQARWLLDQLNADEYRDELADWQVSSAVKYLLAKAGQ